MTTAQIVLLIITGVSFVLMFVCWVCVELSPYAMFYNIGAFICFAVAATCLTAVVRLPLSPQKEYENLQKDVLEAQRELQKFLIDHPEFKEIAE